MQMTGQTLVLECSVPQQGPSAAPLLSWTSSTFVAREWNPLLAAPAQQPPAPHFVVSDIRGALFQVLAYSAYGVKESDARLTLTACICVTVFWTGLICLTILPVFTGTGTRCTVKGSCQAGLRTCCCIWIVISSMTSWSGSCTACCLVIVRGTFIWTSCTMGTRVVSFTSVGTCSQHMSGIADLGLLFHQQISF